MSDAPKWHEVYGAYWRPLTDVQKQAWEYELLEGPIKVRNCSPDMISSALRRLAKKTDRDGRAITPGLQQVRDELFAIMRDKRAEAMQSINLSCGLCGGTGLRRGTRLLMESSESGKAVGVCRDQQCGPDCQHKANGLACYDVAVPCECPAGDAKLRTYPAPDVPGIMRLRDRVRQWLEDSP